MSSICNHNKCTYGRSRYLAHVLQWSLARLPVLLNMSSRSPKALEMSVFLLHLYLLVAKTHGEKRHLHDFIQSLEGGCVAGGWK